MLTGGADFAAEHAGYFIYSIGVSQSLDVGFGAAAAQTHYVVSKAVIDGRTESNIQRLTDSDRVDEIARMLGGKVGAARKHAEELLG